VILALARPQLGKEEFRIRTEGIAIEMAIDRSGSMRALDFGDETRLEVVKRVFRDFVAGKDDLEGRPDDLIGLVVFGGFADSKCPLTLDHGALLQVLKTVEIPQLIRDHRGNPLNLNLVEEEMQTAIGDALALGVARLKEIEAESKVLILLSDGKNTAGIIDPAEAADAAKAFGIKIYSIGVGSTGKVPMELEDEYGRKYRRQVYVELDEATLKMLAEKTEGRYFNARNEASLVEIYQEIDAMEKTKTEGRLYTEYKELFQYALLPGLALILLELLLAATRFRSLP
jgi:Ca-activated chloride channel family protein